MPNELIPKGHGTLVQQKPKLEKPPLYKVLLHNDDFTSKEFVVWALEKIFHLDGEKAERLMLHVHTYGIGICGVYTKEIAKTKVFQVDKLAEQYQHPLKCSYEETE